MRLSAPVACSSAHHCREKTRRSRCRRDASCFPISRHHVSRIWVARGELEVGCAQGAAHGIMMNPAPQQQRKSWVLSWVLRLQGTRGRSNAEVDSRAGSDEVARVKQLPDVSMRVRLAAGLSFRQRSMRGKRTAMPDGGARTGDRFEAQLEDVDRLDVADRPEALDACAGGSSDPSRRSPRWSGPSRPWRPAPARPRARRRRCSR